MLSTADTHALDFSQITSTSAYPTNAQGNRGSPASRNMPSSSEEEDLMDMFDKDLRAQTQPGDSDSPPSSDYSPAVEDKPSITLRPKTMSIKGRAARSASATGPPARASSPTNDTAVASNVSSAFTRLSLDKAAQGWSSGAPKPIKRDGQYAAEKARVPLEVALPERTAPHLRKPGPLRPMPNVNGRQQPGRNTIVNPFAAAQANLPKRPLGPPRPGPPPGLGSRNIEIRIGMVPLSSKKEEIYSLLADGALHRFPFSTKDYKLNFWIHLPRARIENGNWGQNNEGYA